MLDLDKFINNSIKIKVLGEVYDILEPTLGMNMEIDKIESDLDEKNVYQKRIDVVKMLMNHNKQEKVFTDEELKKIPFEGIARILAEISLLRLNADKDPNLESRSLEEK